MLEIHVCESADAVKAYYAAGDYYIEGSREQPGRWGGQLAKMLGLSGVVGQREFDALADNLDPRDMTPLTLRHNTERRVAYDFTFSAPKSVSLLYEWTQDGRILGAFNRAVDETMRDIEAEAKTRVRKDGADYDRVTGKLVYASFNHFEGRSTKQDGLPDPQMHRHVVAFNVTYDPVEHCFKAGQFGDLKSDGDQWMMRFHSRLAEQLAGIGFQAAPRYEVDDRGKLKYAGWDVDGVSRGLVEKYSRRTQEVMATAKQLGITDPKVIAKLAATTRQNKQKDLSREQLRDHWFGRLTTRDKAELDRVVKHSSLPTPQPGIGNAEAVRHSILHHFEQESVVPLKHLEIEALRYGLGSATPEGVNRELLDQGVITRVKNGRVVATTKKALSEERFYTVWAVSGRGTVSPVDVPAGLERGQLDDDQWSMVTGLLGSHDRVTLTDAAAGVGKTTALQTLDEGMRLAGQGVTYLGSTTTAVDELRKAGFQAETVAAFLLSEKMQKAAQGGRVVVDEVSMLSHKDAFRLFQTAKAGEMRLDLVGDSRQHGSVGAGAFMRVIQEYGGLTPFRIRTIKRQENADHKGAVGLMYAGQTAEGFDKIDALGWVKEISDEAQRYRSIADEYVQLLKDGLKWDEILLLSPTHAEGRRVTDAVRDALRSAGRLGEDEREFPQLIASNLTEAQRGEERFYQPGVVDVLQFFQRAKGHSSGSRIEVAEVDRESLPLGEAAKFQAYRKASIKLSEGDVIRFTANGKTLVGDHQIRNGKAYKVAGFTEGGNIRLENGWIVAADFGHFKYAVETSFGAQGKTVKRAIVGQSSHSFAASNMEQIYVTASRAKQGVTVYTDDKEGLRDAIGRSSAKLAALDLLEPPKPESIPTVQRSRWRVQLARWRRAAMLVRPWTAHGDEHLKPQAEERQMSHGR